MLVKFGDYSVGSIANRCDLQFKSKMFGLNSATLQDSMGRFLFLDEVP